MSAVYLKSRVPGKKVGLCNRYYDYTSLKDLKIYQRQVILLANNKKMKGYLGTKLYKESQKFKYKTKWGMF